MAINEWKIWRKLRIVKEEYDLPEEVKVKDDLDAIISFLKEMDVKDLIKQLETMRDTVNEEGIVEKDLAETNIKKQIEFFDKILNTYSYFENDFDINGIRLRKIGEELLKKAKERGLLELVREKKKDLKWRV